jgi:4-hydroxy-2-oxoheptanedioate aldolase
MRGNRAKEKLNAGQIAIVASGQNTSDGLDLLGPLDFDGFWLEGEHGPVTWDNLGDLSRACDLWGKTSLVRIHANEPGIITRTLDLGANGLVIPHVNTRAEAERVVQAAKFAPIGRRGIFGGRRSYGDTDYFQHANEETLIVVLIEEMQAVENLAEILTVDHIDVFFVAPGDLAQTMGLVGQMWHDEVQAVVEKALAQIVAAGRVAGTLGVEDRLERYINLGARFFSVNANAWLQAGAAQYLAKVAALSPSE